MEIVIKESDEDGCALVTTTAVLLFLCLSTNENIFLAISGPGICQDLISGYSCSNRVSVQ
jgi:hypothetical protein